MMMMKKKKKRRRKLKVHLFCVIIRHYERTFSTYKYFLYESLHARSTRCTIDSVFVLKNTYEYSVRIFCTDSDNPKWADKQITKIIIKEKKKVKPQNQNTQST